MAPKGIRGAARAAAAAFLLIPLLFASSAAGNASPAASDPAAPSYEQRASAEKTSRTRYRKLEIASAILIIGCGGAVIFWAVRRK